MTLTVSFSESFVAPTATQSTVVQSLISQSTTLVPDVARFLSAPPSATTVGCVYQPPVFIPPPPSPPPQPPSPLPPGAPTAPSGFRGVPPTPPLFAIPTGVYLSSPPPPALLPQGSRPPRLPPLLLSPPPMPGQNTIFSTTVTYVVNDVFTLIEILTSGITKKPSGLLPDDVRAAEATDVIALESCTRRPSHSAG